MITRAIIESKISKTKYLVRIPFFNKSSSSPLGTNTSDLYTAMVSVLPNSNYNFKTGDAVFIGFEDHDSSKPVILGQLCRENPTEDFPELNVSSIHTTVDAYLPYITHIGEITPEEIACLKGANANLQFQIEILREKIAKLEDKLYTHTYGIVIERAGKKLPAQEDVDAILDYTVNAYDLNDLQKICADVDDSGEVDAHDSTLILKFIKDPVPGKYGKVGLTFKYED